MTSKQRALDALADTMRSSGLIDSLSSGVVMVSGGADSACLAAGVAQAIDPKRVHALHVNYGLRDSAERDELVCRDLCSRLRIDLHIERPEPLAEDGNLQAAAREVRYAAAERLRMRAGGAWIATGHTRTDLAETVLYRLAASPGARALRCLHASSGRVVRPLLGLERSQTRRLAAEAELPFADDESNLDLRFARNRIRAEALPALRELGPVERNIAETQTELIEEAQLLDRVVLQALEAAGAGAGAITIRADALAGWEPALRRLALRALAERACGHGIALGRRRSAEIVRVASRPEGGQVDLGGGVRALCEHGVIRFVVASEVDAAPRPAPLRIPGQCRFGRWEISAEVRAGPIEPTGTDLATVDARALGRELVVRAWREGDRMRPLGMSGTKTLQDLFTDRGVPRSLRHRLPVVTAADRVVWVAGVAVSEDFRLEPGAREAAVLTARPLD
jgi:tRNA(Ile)-lysidine synthase